MTLTTTLWWGRVIATGEWKLGRLKTVGKHRFIIDLRNKEWEVDPSTLKTE